MKILLCESSWEGKAFFTVIEQLSYCTFYL